MHVCFITLCYFKDTFLEMFHAFILLIVSEVDCTVRSPFSLPRLSLCFLFFLPSSWLASSSFPTTAELVCLIIFYGCLRKRVFVFFFFGSCCTSELKCSSVLGCKPCKGRRLSDHIFTARSAATLYNPIKKVI